MALTDFAERLAIDETLTGTLTVALYTAAPSEAGGDQFRFAAGAIVLGIE